MLRRIFFSGVALTVGLALAGDMDTSRADPFAERFEDFDQQLEEMFSIADARLEHEYQVMDQAMEQAYREFAEAIARTWGADEVEVPTRKVWVDYDNQLVSRRLMDFEQGVLTVERLVAPGEEEGEAIEALRGAVQQALEDTPSDLAQRDQALRYAKRLAERQGVRISEPLPPGQAAQPVPEDYSALEDTSIADTLGTHPGSALPSPLPEKEATKDNEPSIASEDLPRDTVTETPLLPSQPEKPAEKATVPNISAQRAYYQDSRQPTPEKAGEAGSGRPRSQGCGPGHHH